MAACSVQATLANILQRLRVVEDNQNRSNTAVAKVRLEMEDGLSRIQELEFSHETSLREINSLLQRFGEQMKLSRRKEQEKLKSAFAHLREEIEEERNMCRLLKLQNKKLLKELEEAHVAAVDAGEDLHRERRAREIMEEVCNELAREIGEDKAEVEQLKQEHAMSKEKVEQELKMMRMAALWKDEKVKTKILEVQRELDDRQCMEVSVADLKSRVEEFVSTLSVAGRESYRTTTNSHIENNDEKPKKNVIEQAKLLRCALEFSMRQIPGDGGGSQVQSNMDIPDEKIVTSFGEDEQNQSNVCECCSDKVHDCESGESFGPVDHGELQVKHSNQTLNLSKKPCKKTRRPQVVVEGDHFDHDADVIPQVRKHLYHSDVDSELECGSSQTVLDSASVKEASDQQSSRHLQGGPKSLDENADVWEDDVTPSAHRLNCYTKDDTSQTCIDNGSEFSISQCRRCSGFYGRTTKPVDAIYLWKSPSGSCQEHLRMDDNQADHDTQCSLHQHLCKDVNSVCADGPNSGEDELGEFDGFYFEPVGDDDDLLEDDYGVHHRLEPCVNACAEAAGHKDEHGKPILEANNRSTQQSRSPNEPACNTLSYDFVKRTNPKSLGMSSIASRRDDALPLSPPPPHKLVLPTLNAIRPPSGKLQYASRRSVGRSVSPSKPQVLQCFRPPPSSPEHDNAKILMPESNKVVSKGEGLEGQHSGASSNGRACLLRPSFNKRACSVRREEEGANHMNVAHFDEGSGSKAGLGDEKGNSLRAELLRARELDLQHINYNVNTKSGAPSLPSNKSSSPSSFRFSPLRRSLTGSSQAGH